MAAVSLPSGSAAATFSQSYPASASASAAASAASSASAGSGATPIVQSWPTALAPAAAGSASGTATLAPISQAVSKTQVLSAAVHGQGQSDSRVFQKDLQTFFNFLEPVSVAYTAGKKPTEEEARAFYRASVEILMKWVDKGIAKQEDAEKEHKEFIAQMNETSRKVNEFTQQRRICAIL
jgi:hypothetical protein